MKLFNVFVWKEKGVHVEETILCLSEGTRFDLLKEDEYKDTQKKTNKKNNHGYKAHPQSQIHARVG